MDAGVEPGAPGFRFRFRLLAPVSFACCLCLFAIVPALSAVQSGFSVTSLDSDGDGLPDDWEIQYGLDPASPDGHDGAGGDPDADGVTNLDELALDTHPRGFYTGYFSDGALSFVFEGHTYSVRDFRHTLIAVVNTLPEPAHVQFRCVKHLRDAAILTHAVTVGSMRRVVVGPEAFPGLIERLIVAVGLSGFAADFSTVIESDLPLVADRRIVWDASVSYDAHAERASPTLSRQWYLAEGATHSGMGVSYLLDNFSDEEAAIRIRYLRPSGPPVEQRYSLAPRSRRRASPSAEADTVLAAALLNSALAVTVEVEAGPPILVEREMTLRADGAHASAGVTAPGMLWHFAEGMTGAFFDTFILIANPNAAAADVVITYLLPDGATVATVHRVDGNSRYTVWVDYDHPRLADTAVAAIVRSTNVPIVAERSLWWPWSVERWYEGHNSAGSPETGTRWAIADGEVGGSRDTETYLLVANTSGVAARVAATLIFDDGTTSTATFAVAPTSRFNIDVRDVFPSAVDRTFSAIVESEGPNAPPIVVERSVYWDVPGKPWGAGMNALATRLP